MNVQQVDEHLRILAAYAERGRRGNGHYFGYQEPAHQVRIQERYRETLRLLYRAGFHPLTQIKILDVGCGTGNLLREMLQWGAQPENLAGIDLRPDSIARARELSPHLDLRCESAVDLPWPDASFDLVCQHTVLTSVLDPAMRRQIAAEMGRVLRPGSAILWYDFFYNNPWNPAVRGISAREIRALFPSYEIQLRRLTLVSPLARRLPRPLLPILYPVLSAFPPLQTHFLGLLWRR